MSISSRFSRGGFSDSVGSFLDTLPAAVAAPCAVHCCPLSCRQQAAGSASIDSFVPSLGLTQLSHLRGPSNGKHRVSADWAASSKGLEVLPRLSALWLPRLATTRSRFANFTPLILQLRLAIIIVVVCHFCGFHCNTHTHIYTYIHTHTGTQPLFVFNQLN